MKNWIHTLSQKVNTYFKWRNIDRNKILLWQNNFYFQTAMTCRYATREILICNIFHFYKNVVLFPVKNILKILRFLEDEIILQIRDTGLYLFKGYSVAHAIFIVFSFNKIYYFLLPISRESIVLGSIFRNRDFDEFTRFDVSWIRKSHF